MKSPKSACVCGSGIPAERCCAGESFDEGEVFLLYRQLGDMRRQMRSLVSGRSPIEASVNPDVCRRLMEDLEPLGPEARPLWHGRPLTREILAYPGRTWNDEKGALVQEKLYMLSEAFGDDLLERRGVTFDRVTDFEAVVESYSDFLLMYYLKTPLDVRPEHRAARRFLGNYYIRTFVDANIDFIYTGLAAIPAFYAYLVRLGLATRVQLAALLDECRDAFWYKRRFEEYQFAAGRGRTQWCREFDYKRMPAA
jgi:hypothetical protein